VKRLLPVLLFLLATGASVLLAVGVNAGTGRLLAMPEDAELLPLTLAPERGKPQSRPVKPKDGAQGNDAVADGAPDAPRPDTERPEPTPEPAPSRGGGVGKDTYLSAILRRNIFDSTKVGVEAAGATEEGGLTISDLQVQLVATIVAEPAEYSSALILDNASKNTVGYGIGDKLEDAEVVAIEQRKVTIKRGNGTLEVLTMESEQKEETTASSDAPAPVTGGDGATTEGITKESETKYTIERSVLDKYLGDLDALSKMAKALPHKGSDGSNDGYRLSGIRRNSPLYALGIRNGDVFHAVNGTSLTNPADAMSAFQTLGSTSAFNFDITRRNNPVTMEYSVK
jgi:type II secretion system protein C